MKDLIVTIDVGTGSTRAGLVSYTGEIIAFSQREYDQITEQPGWAEQSPSSWWEAAVAGLKDLMRDHSDLRGHIAAVSTCGQMHGTVLLDADGALVTDRAVLWNDKRAAGLADQFAQSHDTSALFAVVNNPPTAAWPAFKLRWIQQNQPDLWERTRMVLMPKDYINFKLSGVFATDYSEASCFYLMDAKSRDYSSDLLNEFGISRQQLPDLHAASDVIGQVTTQAAQLTGLPEGLPVVAGTADMAATLLGSGVYQPGTASDSTGTSTLLTIVSPKPVSGKYLNNLHLANEAWGGFTILDAGGDAMRWARLAFQDNAISYADMTDLARAAPAGSNGLFFLPYLTGERNAAKTNSRAQFFGLSRNHRAGDLYRAILEGVAFASAMNLDSLQSDGTQVDTIIASGGGAADDLWLQIKATIYNRPLVKTKTKENGTLGCALLGAIGSSLYAGFDEAVQATVSFEKEILPDPKQRAYFEAAKETYNNLYAHSQSFYDDLDRLTDLAKKL